jgi:NAD(P)-dependent dehydrogenase (short-subunit alcohol dehydrogenase family)
VVVADIFEERARENAARVGHGAIGLHFDCGVPESIRAGIEETVSRFGRIDILFNNAAVTDPDLFGQDRTAVDTPIEIWDLTMNVNVRGVMLGCKYAIPHMARQGGGSIINTASDAALAGDNVRIAYGTSKGAVVALTKYVAAQHGRQNIRCNAILPGPILTAALERFPDLIPMLKRQALMKRLGKAEDIAAMAAFLAADESEFITGQAYSVDGGHMAHQPQMADMKPFEAPERAAD